MLARVPQGHGWRVATVDPGTGSALDELTAAPPRAASPASRHWRVRDALACYVLLLATGLGAIYYVGGPTVESRKNLGWVTWPWDGWAYAAVLAAAVCLLAFFVMSQNRYRIPNWLAILLLLAVLTLATAEYVTYVGQYAPWSDNTTALDIGWHHLVAGQNPYEARTQLGNAITPMLGGFLLAGPVIVVFGSLAALGMLWLYGSSAALALVAGPQASLTFTAGLLITPLMRLGWPNQFDFWINAAALVAFGSAGYVAAAARRSSWRARFAFVGSAVLFGCAVAYRLPLSMVAVPLVVAMWRRSGRGATVRWTVWSGGAAAVLTVVPMLVNAVAYGPSLHVIADRAGNGTLPYAAVIVLLVTVAALTGLSARVRTLAGAWGAGAVSVGLGFGLNSLLQVPAIGLRAAMASYSGVAGMGAVIVFGLAALVLPLDLPPGERTTG